MFIIPYWIDLLGVLMFAMSGALAASDRNIHRDFFGITFTGFITAIGGGTIRDIILDLHPLAWIRDMNYMIAIGTGVTLSVVFSKALSYLRRTLFLFDTMGIALYTILGVQKSLAAGVNPIAAVVLGMFSAVFGGVLRDTLLNEIPLIFRKEIYATACLAGGTLYALLVYNQTNVTAAAFAGIALIIVIRILAVVNSWSLPSVGQSEKHQKEG
ncbi:MAG: trimeric intracellular cation channel family protein [Bacteroidia bacterium]